MTATDAPLAASGPGERRLADPSARTRGGPDLRLATAALAAWVCVGVLIGVAEAVPAVPVVVAVATGAAAIAVLALDRHRGRRAVLALACTGLALGATAVGLHVDDRRVEPLLVAADRHRTVELHVEVTATPAIADRHVAVAVVAVRDGDRWQSASVPAVAFGLAEHAGRSMRIGTTLEARVRVERAEPGDRAAYLLFADGPVGHVGQVPIVLGVADDLRSGFTALAAALPGDGGGLLPGLAIGDTSRLDPSLEAAMTASSLGHLTAVSGANCAVVVGLVLAVARGCGVARGLRSTFALVALGGFVILVTPEPSVLRAAVMCSAVLVGGWSGRSARGVPVLALAVLTLVLGDPWIAREYGFILSVLATGALLVLAPPLADRLGHVMPRGVALVVAVPLSAQIVCQPVVLLIDPTVPLYAIPANLLAGPAAPLATVGGLAACLLHPLAPSVAAMVAGAAWLPAAWIAAVARFFSSVPGARLPWFDGWVGVAGLVLVTAVAGVALLGRPRSRRIAVPALALVGALLIGQLVADPLIRRARLPGDWQVGACDVGQGDATLIRDGGAVALVDAGEEPEPVGRCLDAVGVGRVSLLVLTHFDRDHVGGAAALVGRVDRVLTGPPDTPEDQALLDRFSTAGARVELVERGDEGALGRLRWRVLWPSPRHAAEPGNASSVVLQVTPASSCRPCLSALLLGDLGEGEQDALRAAGAVGAVDVVKVAHHGSRDQSPRLYDAASARVALIGVGADNGYGHPTDELLALLRGDGTAVTRTDLHGLVLVSPVARPRGGTGIGVWRERDGAPP